MMPICDPRYRLACPSLTLMRDSLKTYLVRNYNITYQYTSRSNDTPHQRPPVFRQPERHATTDFVPYHGLNVC